jgi:hypothetical protein
MISQQFTSTEGLLKRFLWLYGLYALLNNLGYLFGYYFLPERFMRSSPQVGVGGLVATPESFWMQFVITLVLNLGGVGLLAVVLNLNQVKGFPAGYVLPISLAITGGLMAGTNSFAASDLKQFNAWEGMALGQSIAVLLFLFAAVRQTMMVKPI